MADTHGTPPGEPVEFDDEVSLTDIAMRLWRRRGWVAVGPALAVVLALAWAFVRAAGINAPVVFYVELRGISNQLPPTEPTDQPMVAGPAYPNGAAFLVTGPAYPNGAAFSPQDLLLPEVLSAMQDSLQVPVSPDALPEALRVEFGSPLSDAVAEKNRQRLAVRNLSVAEIDRINQSFAEELQAVSQRGLRIEVDYAKLGITERAGRQIAVALPQAWSQVFVERFRIFLPTNLPSVAAADFGDLGSTSEILIADGTLRNLRAGVEILNDDNRLVSLMTSSGRSVSDLARVLDDYEMVYFLPIYGRVFVQLDLLSRTHVRERELRIRELDMQIEELNSALQEIQLFRVDASQRTDTRSGAGMDVMQLDDSALRRIIDLATQAEMASYFSETLNMRRELATERADLVTRLARTEAEVRADIPAEMLQELRALARDGLNEIVGEYRDLVQRARQKLRSDQGILFHPLGEAGVQTPWLPERLALILIGAFMAGLLASVTVVLVVPENT